MIANTSSLNRKRLIGKGLYCSFIFILFVLVAPCTFCHADDGLSLIKKIFPSQDNNQFTFSTRFTGNTFFKDRDLLAAAHEELMVFDLKERKKTAVDDAAFKMELAYREAGYPSATVEYQIVQQEEHCDVLFSVSEGDRVLIQNVLIKGNSSYGQDYLLGLDKKLTFQVDRQTPFPYVDQQIKAFSRYLIDFYMAEGYLDVSIRQPEFIIDSSSEQHSIVEIQIDEGNKYMVGEIRISPDSHDELNDITTNFREVAYNPRLKLLLKSKIQEFYQNRSYADISTTVDTLKRKEESVIDLDVVIQKGEKVFIQEIVVQGNERTGEHYILKRISLAVGEPYTLTNERQSFSRLYQTGLFSKVVFSMEQLDQPGDKKLIVTVEEKPTKELYVEPGWGSYELLRLAAGYTDKNLFGTGRSFRLENNVSIKSRQILAGFTDHYFMDTQILADFPLYYRYRQEPDYTIEENGVGVFFSQKFNNKARVSGGYSYSSKSITDNESTHEPTYYSDNNYNNAALTLSLSRDTRNDYFLPQSGYHGNVSLEYADTVIGGDLSYLRFTTSMRHFKKIQDYLVLAMRYNMGVILPGPGQDSIPLDERFFNGGENSVRSFSESQLGPKDSSGTNLGGTAFNTLSFELRRTFTSVIAGSFFVDAGNISPNRTTMNGTTSLADERQNLIDATWKDFFKDFRYGIGCGVQYLLPIGPARFDIAYNPDSRTDNESDYAIHLSVGMAF